MILPKIERRERQITAPKEIFELVKRFERNREAYRSGAYNETQLRREFVDPFFEALGWDVSNKQGYAEAYKDVIHEDAIKVGSFTKAPDYCFRIGGTRKFFLETKKPSVNLKDDISPAFQLRRYAWSAKLPLSILADFEEFAIYDCRIKPVITDKASTARIIYLSYTEYADHLDEIASVFSREAVLKGSFDKYAESTKGKKGTAEVDAIFLKEIESWRELLARNLALRNPGLTQRELNFAVQATIDRIIFLRICEDRGIEDYGRLMALQNGGRVYERFCHLLRQADDRYNSGLFHFSKEKDHPEPLDELTPSLIIDDAPLKDIIKRLYYPESPYEFSVLPADILGQVYEQFLGKVIRLTPGHRAIVEDKPQVKKAGGVYYTPTYIVDYIVNNTVGKLLEGKTLKQVVKLKILDPACGSGSFLIAAYQYLLDWHLQWYENDGATKWLKKKSPTLYQGRAGEWRLTTNERKRILLNNIFGVDIDSQAVEVTKLSLLLKVLEGETGETLNAQLTFLHERALPDLGSNIKCGNSLIGPDFHESQQMSLLDEEERYRINVFDWNTEFPEIMQAGGFDAVIGNPPYVRQEMLSNFKDYFSNKYQVFQGTADLYAYFLERGFSLLNKGGKFGYIVSNKWMRANYGSPLRKWLKGLRIEQIVDFGDLPVFQKSTTYPCILILSDQQPRETFNAVLVKTLDFPKLEDYVGENHFSVRRTALSDDGWALVDEKTQILLEKLRKTGIPLGEYVNGKICYGIKTGLNEAFVIDAETRDRLIAEDPKSAELIKPFLLGRDIKRYQPSQSNRFLLLIPSGWTGQRSGGVHNTWLRFKENHPAIASHLEPFSEKAEKRWDKGEYWWELRPCDYYNEFEKAKILLPDISTHGDFMLDESGSFYSANTTYLIGSSDKYLLGILNSSLMSFYYRNLTAVYRGGYLRFFTQYMSQLPIRQIDFSSSDDNKRHDQIVRFVDQMLELYRQLAAAKTAHEKTALQRQINATDAQIDQLVYKLYDLTDREIKIVAGGK